MRQPAPYLAVGLLLALACTSTPPPQVAVHASDTYMERLAGKWVGNYWSGSSGRSGRITFELTSEEGIAHGEVLMVPATKREDHPDAEPHDRSYAATPLHIELVKAADNRVTGTLEPYRDPDCDCMLSTSFFGTLRGDVIEGEFLSLGGPGHVTHTGGWRVEKQ